MQIEVVYRTGSASGDAWGADPSLRAEIKTRIAAAMARVLRTQGLISWDTHFTADGEFVVRGFLSASLGTKTLVDHTVELNPKA